MACALHDMGKDIGPAGFLQRLCGLGQGLRRDDIIGIPMHQKHRRAYDDFIFQTFG